MSPKLLIASLLLTSASWAVFTPATDTRALTPSRLVDVRIRTANEIQARASAGYHFASVDMDGASWQTEKEIMQELRAAGYTVVFGNDRHVYGWNSLNGALVVKW